MRVQDTRITTANTEAKLSYLQHHHTIHTVARLLFIIIHDLESSVYSPDLPTKQHITNSTNKGAITT